MHYGATRGRGLIQDGGVLSESFYAVSSSLVRASMGKGDRCAVFGCNNDRRYKSNFIIEPHINAFDGSNELRFWKCRGKKHYNFWTKLLNRVDYRVDGNAKVCSNYFKFGRPTDIDPHLTLYLKGYEEHGIAPRKSPKKRFPLA